MVNVGENSEPEDRENGEKGKLMIEVKDTPERTKNAQITTSGNRVEDSPVYNFLNNLSPIEQMKSRHITQTINPHSFVSVPSVFTSPHVTSIRESRFLQRHQFSDSSKPEFSSRDSRAVDTNEKLPSYELSKIALEFAQNLECDGGSGHMPDHDSSSSTVIPFNKKDSCNQINQDNKEATLCDWDQLVSDELDLLIFESPAYSDPLKKQIDPGTSVFSNSSGMQKIDVPSTEVGQGNEPEERNELREINETRDVIDGPSMNDPCEEIDNEHLSGLPRGLRRRCLVFGMSENRKNHLDVISNSDSPMLSQSPGTTGTDSSPCILLPSIGLHLNNLAETHKNYTSAENEASGSGKSLIGPNSPIDSHAPINDQESLNNTQDLEICAVKNSDLSVDDSRNVASEEINQSSPMKKRRRSEQSGEGETCKRCNCKKSKCLKLYCECFAAGVYCVEPCSCTDCFNKPIHEETVIATRQQIETRNPLAFAPKVIKGSDSLSETGEDSSKTPASARHKRGCNCKKSGCLKKYCECYQGGVGCSINCRCEGCKNVFGRKEGFGVKAVVAAFQEEQTETPLRAGSQQPVHHHPVSSNSKPPRSSFPCIVSSSSQALGKQNLIQPPPKFNATQDEVTDFLLEGSPVKSLSPNGKRISPHKSLEISSRTMILQSIPAFPSLTPKQ